jgi:hypothetical protein
MPDRRERIRMLNDQLRTQHKGGSIYLTRRVANLPSSTITTIDSALTTYDAFDQMNDPYGEHDFALFEVDGFSLIYKIDYYAIDSEALSPDPADENLTRRVMTIMLAEEY